MEGRTSCTRVRVRFADRGEWRGRGGCKVIYCRHGFLGRKACSYLALLDSDVIDFAAAAAAAVLAVKGRPFIFTFFF